MTNHRLEYIRTETIDYVKLHHDFSLDGMEIAVATGVDREGKPKTVALAEMNAVGGTCNCCDYWDFDGGVKVDIYRVIQS